MKGLFIRNDCQDCICWQSSYIFSQAAHAHVVTLDGPETYLRGKPLEHKTILSWASLTENSTVKMFKILGSHSRIYTERITINEHLYRKDLKWTDKYVTILTN